MSTGGPAGPGDDREYVDKDVTGSRPAEPAGDEHEYVDKDVTGNRPGEAADDGAPREGEYVDSDVGPDDTDPPTGSYTDRDVPGR